MKLNKINLSYNRPIRVKYFSGGDVWYNAKDICDILGFPVEAVTIFNSKDRKDYISKKGKRTEYISSKALVLLTSSSTYEGRFEFIKWLKERLCALDIQDKVVLG